MTRSNVGRRPPGFRGLGFLRGFQWTTLRVAPLTLNNRTTLVADNQGMRRAKFLHSS